MKENVFKGMVAEFHILQSFPVTCLNRDDVGAPKTAMIGGVQRARVSSQAWKRQVRLAMKDFGVKIATRSKHLEDQVVAKCLALEADEEKAKACGEAISQALAKDTLLYFTDTEVQALTNYAQKSGFDAGKLKEKKKKQEIQKLVKTTLSMATDGLDIALFGRMVAMAPELNVAAASSFAHAISTHAVAPEVEFFTALDDLDPLGAGHMDNLEFVSSTYYRYVSLDLGQLFESLEGNCLKESVAAFVKALFIAVPSARQTTLSGACGWDYAKVLVRKGQRIQLSFDKPVKAVRGSGYLEPSIEALEKGLEEKKAQWGSLYGLIDSKTFGGAEKVSIDDIIGMLEQVVGKQLGV